MFSGALVYYGFFVAIGAASSLLFSDILRVNGLAIGTAATIGMAIAMAVVLCLCARVFYRAFHGLSKAKRLLLALVALMIAVCVPAEKLVKRPAGDFWADITALGIRNSQSNSNEVWLSSVMVDGEEIALSDLALSQGWSYAPESNSVWASPEDDQATDALRIGPFPGIDSFELFFGEHAWSGIVRIDTAMESREVDLYAPESSSIQVGSFAMQGGPYTTGNKLKLLLCYLVIAAWLFVGMVCLAINQKVFFPIAYAQLTVTVFLLSPYVRPAPSVLLFLGVLSAGAYIILDYCKGRNEMQPYFSRNQLGLVITSCLYASFASFGYRLFLVGDYIQFSLDRLLYYGFGAIWMYPVIIALLFLLELTANQLSDRQKIKEKKKAWHIGLLSCLACLAATSIAFIGYYPGGFPPDAMTQFSQALNGGLDNWHPVVHTLIIRLLLKIYNNPAFVVFFQLVLFALIVGKIAKLAYEVGLDSRIVIISAGIFGLLPSQAMTNIAPLKDFMFTYALVWGTFLLFEFIVDASRIRKVGYCIQLTVCLYLTKELRHNGIIPFTFIIVGLLILTFKQWRTVRFRAILCSILAIVMVAVTEGPVFRSLEVIPNAVSPYVTMFCAVGSCVNKGKTFSDDTTQKLEKVMTLENWAKYYNRFRGHNDYRWADGGNREMDLTQFSAREAFSVYLEALRKYPDIVIKDRLDGMNIMWDVTQPEDEGNYNSQTFTDRYILEDTGELAIGKKGVWFKPDNAITNSYSQWEYFAFPGEKSEDQLNNLLLWRSGAYLIFLWVLLTFINKHKLWEMWLPSLPLLGNIVSMMLVLYSQNFRYIYFIQLLTVTLTLMALYIQIKHKQDVIGLSQN